jgi:hypothetical protein
MHKAVAVMKYQDPGGTCGCLRIHKRREGLKDIFTQSRMELFARPGTGWKKEGNDNTSKLNCATAGGERISGISDEL